MKLAVPQRRRAQKHGGEGGQQIGVGGAGRAAAQTRSEQRTRQAGAHPGNDETEDFDAIDADAGEARRRWISWPIAVRSTKTQSAPTTSAMTMIGLGMPNSQRPSANCRNSSGTPATIGTPAE